MILVDFRENQSKVPKLLQQFNIPIQTADLAVDYIISKECFVERKTISDFITSVVDGRLFKQVDYLARNCVSPLLLLEGGGLYQQGRMSANTIRGTFLWITIKKKVPFIRTYNEYDTACILRLLAKQYGISESISIESLPRKRKNISLWKQQIDVLTQVPGIGRQSAKDLLSTFGSIANIAHADDSALVKLSHIGKERIASIRQIFPQPVKARNDRIIHE